MVRQDLPWTSHNPLFTCGLLTPVIYIENPMPAPDKQCKELEFISHGLNKYVSHTRI